MKNDDDKLDDLLSEWRCGPPRNLPLEASVWRRIAEREDSSWSESAGIITAWRRHWAGPALAASIALAGILTGIGAAELQMQRGQGGSAAQAQNQLQSQSQSYFESINPVALARHEHR